MDQSSVSTKTWTCFDNKQGARYDILVTFCDNFLCGLWFTLGQTLSRVGLALDSTQCFAHGQLYVGCSRVCRADSLRFLMRSDTDNKITNCVQRRLLDKYDIDQGSASLQRLGIFSNVIFSYLSSV